jgi:hypothetical protein
VLSFFMGCFTSLFLSIGVLLALPSESPHSYSEAYFLTPMPVFRVVFSVLLCCWSIGVVIKICERWDINHTFMLKIDPRCRVTPEWFWAKAAMLTTIWITLFGMYVVDYKWRVLPTIHSDTGINQRSSLHFLLYPTLLVCFILGVWLWPSRICRNRYKYAVAKACGRCSIAPFREVDFADNIVGDVLTSLAKPLQDVPAAVCYFASPHPQPKAWVERFIDKGDTCSLFTHHAIMPVLNGLPFFFRAMQCLRRYYDTKEGRNLLNFGKYSSYLVVVVVSAVYYESTWLIAATSVVATIYAATWDIYFDWGLRREDFFPPTEVAEELGSTAWKSPGSRNGSQVDHADCVKSELKQTKSGKVKPEQVNHPTERKFPIKVYWLCSLLDVVARFMWVLTLMPVNIITRRLVGRVLLVSMMSSVEIMRRSMWAVLRIEYEQLANASGFRALLWVPSTNIARLNKDGGENSDANGGNLSPTPPDWKKKATSPGKKILRGLGFSRQTTA